MPRFFQPPDWRHVVTDLDSVTLTFLDRIATDGRFEFDLNTPAQFSFRVPSSSPEVNIPHDDLDPFLAEGNRLIYSFRREGGTPPWVVRHAGFVLSIEDLGDAEAGRSECFVFDPWQYLYNRPCIGEDGEPIGAFGEEWFNEPVANIALEYLRRTIIFHGLTGIDAGTSWGGTADFNGFIAASTQAIDYNVPRTKTVGELWEDLCALELIDIELTPIYDITNRPGYLSEMNIYRQPGLVTQPRGEEQPDAIFSWDLPPRTLSRISRTLDGRDRANSITFYNRQGLEAGGSPLRDGDSITKYGEYWYEQQFPDQIKRAAVGRWARAQLSQRTRGRREVFPVPSPQQPPFLWSEYFVGDRVPVYASNRLRETIPTADDDVPYERVLGITIELDPQETATEIRLSPEAEVTLTS
jgi:hypothetical protein